MRKKIHRKYLLHQDGVTSMTNVVLADSPIHERRKIGRSSGTGQRKVEEELGEKK